MGDARWLRCRECARVRHDRCLGRDAGCACYQCHSRAILADAEKYSMPMVRELVALVIQREVSRAIWRRKEPVELHCRRCGRPVLWSGQGRRRKWCSAGCRKAVQRRQARQRAGREAEAAEWLELQREASAARPAHQAPPAGSAGDWASWPWPEASGELSEAGC